MGLGGEDPPKRSTLGQYGCQGDIGCLSERTLCVKELPWPLMLAICGMECLVDFWK